MAAPCISSFKSPAPSLLASSRKIGVRCFMLRDELASPGDDVDDEAANRFKRGAAIGNTQLFI